MLGNYSRIGYEFKNRLNIFAVMKVKFNLRQTSDENKDTLIYLVCTINHKQEKSALDRKYVPNIGTRKDKSLLWRIHYLKQFNSKTLK